MKNIGQIGFDFGDAKSAFRADPRGTWVHAPLNFSQHEQRMQQAWSKLPALTGFLHAVFEDSLTAANAEHDAQVSHCGYDSDERTYTLWNVKPNYVPADIAKVIEHCRHNASRSTRDVEYKIRTDRRGDVHAGVHVAGIGSIVAFMHASRNEKDEAWYNIRFVPFRDNLFRDHYDDNADYVRVAESIWSCAYAGQTLAEAGKKIPSVRTFRLNGREYIYTGASYHGEYRQAQAWSITSAADWTGDTFTYQETIAAYNDGRLERGDHRGQLVRVRGELCVLDSYLVVFDDTPGPIQVMSAEEEEEEEEDYDQHVIEDEEVEFA